MTYDQLPGRVPATANHVLAVFRDWYRQQCQFASAVEPGVDLTFATTIAEWQSACDLIGGWRTLGRILNGMWDLDQPDEAWRSVLKPAGQRTLRDLCEFIASGAVRPTIEPLKILGAECLPAGAFLAIRSLLREAGVDTDPIAPSTPYGEYARRHLGVFLGPISRLAPGALPAVKVRAPLYDLSCTGLGCGLVIGVLSWPLALAMNSFFAAISVVATGLAVVLVSSAGMAISARIEPNNVAFGDLGTFGDLARAVAGHTGGGEVSYAGDGSVSSPGP